MALGPKQSEVNETTGPTYQFKAHNDQQVQSMLTIDNFLITGTCAEIAGWNWKVITSLKSAKAKPSWVIQIPAKKYVFFFLKVIQVV